VAKTIRLKARTHFEQVPIAAVKKIAVRTESKTGNVGRDSGIVKSASRQPKPFRAGRSE
jgi:hypothetical protein